MFFIEREIESILDRQVKLIHLW